MKFIVLLVLHLSFSLLIIAQTETSKPMSNQDSIKAELKIKMPVFEGGQERLITYLSTFLRYPDDAVRDSIQGTVLVEFMINTTGKVTNARVLKGISPSCDTEAVRVVSSMPAGLTRGDKCSPTKMIIKITRSFCLKHKKNIFLNSSHNLVYARIVIRK